MKTAFHPSAATDSGLQASMKIDSAGSGVHLPRHGSLQLRDAAGWTIKALAGAVWITQDRDIRDVVLEAGESFVVDRNGATLIYSLDDAKVCVSRKPLPQAELLPPATGRLAERAAKRWRPPPVPAVSA